MEKDIPKYSIITPMFNSFNLMGPYFRSFLDQTYKNFEIIIIDDCSIDDSFKKAIEYSKNSPLNIKVFKTDNNAGPGNARNVGTHWAKGEWITYVDNDDWVDSKLLESIEKIITQYKVNCVVYDYALTNGKVIKKEKSMYHGKEGIISVADGVKYIRNHSVGKFYKKECIENIKYPKIKRCEDVAFVAPAIVACESIYYYPYAFYYYYQRHSSLSNNTKLNEKDMVMAFSILKEKIGEKYPNELKEKSVPDLLYGGLLMMCKAHRSSLQIKKYIKSYETNYPEWWKCEIIDYMGKAKRLFLYFARYKLVFMMKLLSFIHSKVVG